MMKQQIEHLLVLLTDTRSRKEILSLTGKTGKGVLLHPLHPFILLKEAPKPFRYPLVEPIPTPPSPLLFDTCAEKEGKVYLTSLEPSFRAWLKETEALSEGFVLPESFVLSHPVEVSAWRGAIVRIETTYKADKAVRYRWDILHEFHLA